MCILIVGFVFISSVSCASNSFIFFFFLGVTCNFRMAFNLCWQKVNYSGIQNDLSPFVTFEIMRLYDQTAVQISPGWFTWMSCCWFFFACILFFFVSFFFFAWWKTIVRCTHLGRKFALHEDPILRFFFSRRQRREKKRAHTQNTPKKKQ